MTLYCVTFWMCDCLSFSSTFWFFWISEARFLTFARSKQESTTLFLTGNVTLGFFCFLYEVVYPRVNNFSILILSLSYLFLILSLISEFGGGTLLGIQPFFILFQELSLSFGFNIYWYSSNLFPNAFPRI
mgnify:CR=1 FL=1